MALKITPAPSRDQRNFCLSSPAAKSWQISLGFAAGNSKSVHGRALFVCFMGHTHFTGITFCLFPCPCLPLGLSCLLGTAPASPAGHLQLLPGFLHLCHSPGLAWPRSPWGYFCAGNGWDGSRILCSFVVSQ